jgi:hypothetical protein
MPVIRAEHQAKASIDQTNYSATPLCLTLALRGITLSFMIKHLNSNGMLKNNSRALAVRSLVLVALCTVLFSFSGEVGGESFTIHLNDKLVLQEHVSRETDVKNIHLDQRAGSDVMKIHYNHCGRIGKGRSIAIKNLENKILKEWSFADATEGSSSPMKFNVEEILAAQKKGSDKLKLYYSSKELLPNGQLLAVVILDNGNSVSLN